MTAHFDVLGIDPGKHVGISHLRATTASVSNPHWAHLGKLQIESKLLETQHDFPSALARLREIFESLSNTRPLVVAVEHFVLTRTSTFGGAHFALEVTGVVHAFANIYTPRATLCTDQKPAEAKLISNPTLNDLGIRSRGDGSDDHAHMAAKHALLACARVRKGKLLL
ncbi:hypothetical protein PP301_gp119 [Gordonia phage GMA2]|uniref:Uncharacterized protein n=1 Tax=Gordonia phage GMA2 TaxID=1647283 RepID=A0A0K0N776_9CAUD|nr:hypothetical protein PP301_gp119 [Gordonia phage GMA2]AKJ72603.1 hypothetical protein GMA2_65 [Gordonia phage GMA2]